MKTGFSFAKIELGGAAHPVAELRGSEAVSTLFTYTLGFPATMPLVRAEDAVGASATLMLEDRVGNLRTVAGVVAECNTSASTLGIGEVRLVLRPKVFGLTLGRASRTFQDTTLKAILREVLGGFAAGTTFAFPDGGTIPYRVERGESDWSFIERTLADAGLVYFFDHSAGSALVIADNPDRGRFIDGGVMPVHLGAAIGSIPEGIVGLAKVGAATSTMHSMKGFRWEKPALAVGAAAGGGKYESYDRVLEVPGLNDIGGARVNAARGRAKAGRVVGTARTVRLYPGASFTTAEEGSVAVHDVDISIDESNDTASIVSTFSSAASGGGALPERAAPPRTHAGLSLAIVAADPGDEVYPEGSGRVRAQHHWDRSGNFEAGAGTWLRPTQRLAPGSMMFPRTGWVVAAMGQCGDADSPIALGRIHDGDHPPSYGLPANKTRVVYKTATVPGGGSFNEVHFEDRKGEEVMYIHASKNTDILTQNLKSDRVWNDAFHTVDGQQVFEHKESHHANVAASQTVTIGADEIVEIGGSYSKNVSGTETITIGSSRKIDGKLSHSTTSKLTRKLKVGAALIDISLGQINRSSKNALTLVGGLVLRLAGQSVQRQVGPVWLETIGGLKYAKAGRSIADASAKDFVETVGGSITLKAGTNINEDTDNEAKWVVAGTLSGKADEALIEAYDGIDIVCGQSVLKLDPKGLTFSSVEIDLSGGSLEVLTGLVCHN